MMDYCDELSGYLPDQIELCKSITSFVHTDHAIDLSDICNQQEDKTSNQDGSAEVNGDELTETIEPELDKGVLCLSCDRCRARKTKCDGNRPCASCVLIYMKHHKVRSPQGITSETCDCIYRHAKRRGPVPGSSRGKNVDRPSKKKYWFDSDPLQAQIETLHGKIQAHLMRLQHDLSLGINSPPYLHETIDAMQQEMSMLQQLQSQHQQEHQEQVMAMMVDGNYSISRLPQAPDTSSISGLPNGVKKNLHLLDRNSVEGARLKSFYSLSVDQLFRLPSVPSEEEFFMRRSSLGTTRPSGYHDQSVLYAARFAELALGALASDNLLLASELSNATVTCIRDCLDSVISDTSALFLIAKSFFLHGLFRSFRGDITRYLKYRRVCLSLIPRMDGYTLGLPALIAAISFHDSLAYALHNASEDDLPDIDDVIPPIYPDISSRERAFDRGDDCSDMMLGNMIRDIDAIAIDPANQLWMQVK